MLDEDEKTLVCVFVDEIESLAGKRQYSGSSKEPQDSLRVRIGTVYILVANGS